MTAVPQDMLSFERIINKATFCVYRLNDPCQEDGVRCERTYSTRHSLSLTSDATLFAVSSLIGYIRHVHIFIQ